MGKIRSLNGYQKGILIVMLAMTLIFAVIYPRTITRVGFRYEDTILVPTQENGVTLYSGKIKGQLACFTVSDNNTVVFQYGAKTYGPYTVKEDPDAIPEDNELGGSMAGVEIREGDEILFRGGVVDIGEFYWFCREDGTSDHMIEFSYMTSDGIERDENGNPIDRMKPSVSTIYELTNHPELTHKGEGLAWFGATFICIVNALPILFADELFRWNLSFQIRNAERVEPSDWEIAGRYIGWTAMTIMALVLFFVGLH